MDILGYRGSFWKQGCPGIYKAFYGVIQVPIGYSNLKSIFGQRFASFQTFRVHSLTRGLSKEFRESMGILSRIKLKVMVWLKTVRSSKCFGIGAD